MGVASAEKESDYGFYPWGLYLTSDTYQEAVLLLMDPNLVSLGQGFREYIFDFSSFGSCICDTDVRVLKGKSVCVSYRYPVIMALAYLEARL